MSATCSCPRCLGVATADPKYGFDRAKVPDVKCLMCGKKIGPSRWRVLPMLSRFGQIFFRHERCA